MFVAHSSRPQNRALACGSAALLATVVLLLACAGSAAASKVTIKQFADPLPILPVAQPTSVDPDGTQHYHITMTQFAEQMAHGLPPTVVWGYNGSVPGPVIVVTKGVPAVITWDNELPLVPLLTIDHSLMGADEMTPDVRAVVHVHGAHVPPAIDGLPEQWYTPGNAVTNTYPNDQRAADLIYHDHALGITRLNVYAGLVGGYVIVDPAEAALRLPSGKFDVALVVQDKTFDRDPASPSFGQLVYPDRWVPEYFGDTIIVNGKAWPYERVQARKYRFRVYNASNDRFFGFRFSNGMRFWQIGTDGGLLAHPAKIRRLILGPGERADVVADFSGHRGERIVLRNTAAAPYPSGDPDDPDTTGRVMQFRVGASAVKDSSRLPATLSTDIPTAASLTSQAVQTRDITLSEAPDLTHPDPEEPGMYLPEPMLEGLHYDDPVTIMPKLGTTEIWRYVNLTMDAHPMHEHDVMNRIVARIPFDARAYWHDQATGQLQPLEHYFTGLPVKPAANEDGWKDTVRCPPHYVTEVVMTFTDFTGSYVYHCHILSHEEHDMMRPFEVVP
jgi:spore coat protein A